MLRVLLALLVAAPVFGQTAGPPRRPLLDIVARSPVAAVAAGERFTVALDITPAKSIHVYAPQVVGYRPIGLKVTPQPGLVVRGVTYPAPESYYYAPLKETVPVYQKPFRVEQELTIDRSAATVTVHGTLSYQACDERLCYPPRQAPVTWQISLKEVR